MEPALIRYSGDVTFSISAKGRLTDRDLGRFPGNALFDRIARVVCERAACRARSSTRPGRWRGGSAAGLEAAALSIWPRGTACCRTSCCSWTTRLRKRCSSIRRRRRQHHGCTLSSSKRGRVWRGESSSTAARWRRCPCGRRSGRVEPRLRRADRHRARPRGIGPRTRGGAPLLSRSGGKRRGLPVRMA